MPNIGSRDPYFAAMFNTAAMDSTMEICERKLVTPSGSMRESSFTRGLNASLSSFTAFMRNR